MKYLQLIIEIFLFLVIMSKTCSGSHQDHAQGKSNRTIGSRMDPIESFNGKVKKYARVSLNITCIYCKNSTFLNKKIYNDIL